MNTKTNHARIPVILLFVAAVLWTLWLIPDSLAQQGSPFNSPLPTPMATPTPPPPKLVEDAKMYVAEFGVDLNEAIRRLKLQSDIGDLNAELSKKEEKTFAGLWIQHKPEHRVIVQFTQNGEAILQPYIENGPLTGMIEVRMASVTLNQLRIDQERMAQIVNTLGIRAYTGINVIENYAELNVLDPVQLETALQNSGQQLPTNVKVIRVDEMPREVADIFGGLALTACTSGFSVKTFNGSSKGITTAGHCSNTQTYAGKNLPFQSGTTGGVYDIQWHTAPDFTVRNLVYDGGAYNRYIYSVKFRNNQSVGDWVCKYGKTSGYSCGAIVDKAFDGVNIRADTSVQPGDSGGPWFLGNIAYGTTISSVGDDSVYGPVDHIYNILGLTVMVESELHQSFWRGGQEWSRSAPIYNRNIQWSAVSPWWSGPFTLSSLPGSGNMQAWDDIITGNTLTQGFWRGNQGWYKTVPIVNGDLNWGLASAWSGPISINTMPGSGSMQTQESIIAGNTMTQGVWRGNQGWYRTVPIVNGVINWNSASPWSGPISIGTMPGSGDMQAQTGYVFP